MDNCLEWNLKFWNKNKNYSLYYNSDHVIALESKYVKELPNTYLPLEVFGKTYFINSFEITNKEIITLLEDYLNKHSIDK